MVCLVEAGPDYGPFDDGLWPPDILDGRAPASSHGWSDQTRGLPAARILGGCSAQNMCTLMHGAPDDYAGWAEATGESSLGPEAFAPYLRRAEDRMALRRFGPEEHDPWFRGLAAASSEVGLPVHDDANAPDAMEGLGGLPFNLRGTTRWNVAFAYLDEARERANLTIVADALVDRVSLRGPRASGIEVVTGDARRSLRADRVVLCAGAYGSPAVLARSGIGPEKELRRLGVAPAADLPIGEGLRDHFGLSVRFKPGASMARELAEHRAGFDDASIQGVIKARTGSCPAGRWDLHLLAAVFPAGDEVVLALSSMLLQPEWTGTVRLRSSDPTELPMVTELDLTTGDDLGAAWDGVELARRLVDTEALAGRVARELEPGSGVTPDELLARGRAGLTTYFHPVATCGMGTVTDELGRVDGFENLHVVDASAIPRPLRASPHLTVLALAERAAELFR